MPAYTLIIGTREWSSWSLRACLALAATGQPFAMELVRLRVTEMDATRTEILKRSPSGRVPVLRIGEGETAETVWDSLAICETLAERHPEAHLWPKDPRRRALARAYAAEMHAGFPGLRSQLAMEFARRLPLPELTAQTQQDIARVIDAWDFALTAHGAEGGFLFGAFSIADCMYAPVVSRFTTYGVAVPDRIKDYMERIWALPAMQDWLRAAEQEVAEGIA